MSIRLPVGPSDFKSLIDDQFDFVDKSLFIKEVIEDTSVVLITRPRRFGKTLNMSMLRYFFDINESAADLFKHLKIAQEKALISKHQGQYPVIFLTFKDIKSKTYEVAYQEIIHVIKMIYLKFSPILLNSDKLTVYHKMEINSILEGKANQATIGASILFLSNCLHDHYGKKVCILIDEYDTPIQTGYLNKYYDDIVGLFRNLFGAALKDNPYLFKAVLTGILRVSKESFFSGLNNLVVYSVLNQKYGDYFGFTEDEVNKLLTKADLHSKAEEIRNWYNGYQVGDHRIYNPWSMVSCIMKQGMLSVHWVNTSDNVLIKQLLIQAKESFKSQFELLFEGQTVPQLINEHVVFGELNTSQSAVWSLFLMAGYLTIDSLEWTDRGLPLCQLRIPNLEIRNLYRSIIEEWLADGFGLGWYDAFTDALLDGNMVEFKSRLKQLLEETVSVHDLSHAPESFYHGLMIGLTASLGNRKEYSIRSNRESGHGRYDYMILSHRKDKLTIIFEFKKVNVSQEKPEEIKNILEQSAKEALNQIDSRGYLAEAKQLAAGNILKIGLAFSGKRFVLVYEEV